MKEAPLSLAVLSLAAGLLIVAWLAAPLPAPPLYDGLGLPPEPYRYLQPHQGEKTTKPPTSGHLRLTLSARPSPYQVVMTKEQPPQAQMVLEQGAIRAPAGPVQVTFTIHPVPPPAPRPSGVIDGNVYRFAAAAANGAAVILKKGQVSIDLRGTGAHGNPVIEQYADGKWTRYTTQKYFNIALYNANVSALGDYALVITGANVRSHGNAWLPYLVIGGAVVGLAVIGLVLVRLARVRGTRDQGTS